MKTYSVWKGHPSIPSANSTNLNTVLTCTETLAIHTPSRTLLTAGLKPVVVPLWTIVTNRHRKTRKTVNVASCRARPVRRMLIPASRRVPVEEMSVS
jgi:hypothetical protein